MVSITLQTKGFRKFEGKMDRVLSLFDTRFKPKLSRDLGEVGAKAVRRALRPHRFRGNIIDALVFVKREASDEVSLAITREAALFHEGVRQHAISVEKHPIVEQWLQAKGRLFRRDGRKRRVVRWPTPGSDLHVPGMNLFGIAEEAMDRNLERIGKESWEKSIVKNIGG